MEGEVLFHATVAGDVARVEAAVEAGFNVNTRFSGGRSLLHVAALEGHTDMVRLLIDEDADLTLTDNNGQTALHHCASKGHAECAEALLRVNAPIEATDGNGCTALAFALVGKHQEAQKILLSYGADLHDATAVTLRTDVAAHVPSQLPPSVGTEAIGGFDAGGRREKEDSNDLSSAQFDKTATAELLGRLAADGNAPRIETVLHARRVDLSATMPPYGRTPLHVATLSGQTEVVRLLLDEDADVNAKDSFGHTPLHHCAYRGNVDCAQILLRAGAHTNAQNNVGASPFCFAEGKAMQELLLQHGANLHDSAARSLRDGTLDPPPPQFGANVGDMSPGSSVTGSQPDLTEGGNAPPAPTGRARTGSNSWSPVAPLPGVGQRRATEPSGQRPSNLGDSPRRRPVGNIMMPHSPSAALPAIDNSGRALPHNYLAQHDILTVMQGLTAELIVQQPEQPLAFMAARLLALQQERNGETSADVHANTSV